MLIFLTIPDEVCAEGSDDAADEEDGVGDDEGGVPPEVVGHARVACTYDICIEREKGDPKK